MWLLGKCAPDFKTPGLQDIADFRRDNGAGIVAAARAFVLLCRQNGLIAGGTVAIDGTKLRACASARKVMGPAAAALAADGREVGVLGEAEARPMGQGAGLKPPAYNATEPNDSRMLAPMAIAARDALACQTLTVVADAGYGSATQAAACEAAGILAIAPWADHSGRSDVFFGAEAFTHDAATDTMTCPAGRTLRRTGTNRGRAARYRAEDCRSCPLRSQCMPAPRRHIYRLLDEDARRRMNARADAAAMTLRRSIVEHPFACLKRHLGGRYLLRGKAKAATETALAVTAYNLKKAANLIGRASLVQALT